MVSISIFFDLKKKAYKQHECLKREQGTIHETKYYTVTTYENHEKWKQCGNKTKLWYKKKADKRHINYNYMHGYGN